MRHAGEELAASREEQRARASAAEGALARKELRVAEIEQELQAYRSLPTIRLRDRVLRVPFVGGARTPGGAGSRRAPWLTPLRLKRSSPASTIAGTGAEMNPSRDPARGSHGPHPCVRISSASSSASAPGPCSTPAAGIFTG